MLMATISDVSTSAADAKARKGRTLSLAQRRNIVGYLFVSPFILGFFFWFLIPAAVAFYLVFQKWNLMSPPQFVGLDNMAHLFSDPLLGQSLFATFTYAIISVPVGLLVSF